MEARYGATGPEQMALLMDFLYEAGERSFTGVKGGQPQPQAAAGESSAEMVRVGSDEGRPSSHTQDAE